MDLFDVIRKRRSTRTFSDASIPDDQLNELIGVLSYSPMASNSQELRLIVVSEPARIASVKRFSPGLSGDPQAILALCVDGNIAYERGGKDGREVTCYVNLGIATGYLMLAAESLGLGTCPVRSFHKGAIAEILRLPDHLVPELLITVGYAKGRPRPKSVPPLEEVVHHDFYPNG